ncbi:MAG: hypothetical protein CVV39_02040 [Planctomycetes bacterium HGW-Planctomycetes-1]|nr:MAG: hypothetical protein CVV39_02040 [Planctomycetes bacterium HGW-Planctomycetes-1]
MMKIDQVSEAIRSFFKKTLGTDAKVIKITKSEDGWVGEAEIYEESSFIKSLGLPSRVQDRNTYEIKLTDTLEVTSYVRKREVATAE